MSKKLRLWLDGQCLQTKNRRRGIGRYIEGLIQGITDHCPHVDLHVSINAGIPEEALAARDHLSNWIKPDNIHVWHGVATDGESVEGLTDRRRLSEIALAHHVACIAPDIAVSTNPFEGSHDRATPLLPNKISGVPIASIFYGAFPSQFPARGISGDPSNQFYQRRFAAFRDFVCNICISDLAKRQLAGSIGENRSISIDPRFLDDVVECVSTVPFKQQSEKKAVLYLGEFDWRNNVSAAIEAISLLEHNQKSITELFVAGSRNTDAETALRLRWSELNLPNENLRFIDQIADDILIEYCQKFQAVIQPAHFDGSGLTELEAVLCGVPVITLSASALPTVGSDAPTFFNPAGCADIARQIAHVLNGAEVSPAREAIVGLPRFSWGAAAIRIIDALIDVAGQHVASAAPTDDVTTGQVLLETAALKLPDDLIVGCLARSEIRRAGPQRLIVEATATVISDGGSGIQRVVRKICSVMPSDTNSPVVIGFSDNSSEWFEVKDRSLSVGAMETKQTGSRVFFTPHDQILMLDSSWAFHLAHSHNLLGARIRGAKVTTCLYDTVPIRASGFTHSRMPPVFSQWLLAALTYSTGFICISKAVADEFLEILTQLRFPRPLNIGYWPLGADFGPVCETLPTAASARTITKFLMVGTLEPRKGYRVALDAFDLLWEQNIDVQLTVVGKIGWNVQSLVHRLETHPQWGRRLFWYRDATDIELSQEYASADCLIASSFAEGFGLPIVEAGYFGKPIIASDIPVFREVSSKSVGAKFFAVGDPCSLAESVRSFLATKAGSTTMPEAGQAWENWYQSAVRLKEVVLQDKWYRRYIPDDRRPFSHVSDIGSFAMTEPLAEVQRKHSLKLVDGPMDADTDDALKFIVKIHNDSDQLWSSKGCAETDFGVFLGCRLFSAEGTCLQVGNYSVIPLFIAPGDTVYMPIEIKVSWLKHKDAVARIEMVQKGVCWWGQPLTLPICEIEAATG